MLADDVDVAEVAAALQVSVSLLRRRLRDVPVHGALTGPETSAMARLERTGPSTSAALAKLEQITPQSMGATLSGLEQRGLVGRDSDPGDARLVVLSLTDAGRRALQERRQARSEQLTRALSSGFTRSELRLLMAALPLVERLAQNL